MSKAFPTRGPLKALALLCMVAGCTLINSCGGGDSAPQVCTGSCTPPPAVSDFLTVEDVQHIIAQAANEANARNLRATVAVTDRVGNVLGVFRMTGARATFRITSNKGISGGLENIDILPDTFAAISKALTGAYLSSNGNAFSTRTASQIVQENFNPREANQPAGPLYGVQFSQFSCSDLMRRAGDGSVGPKRSPLGLAADAGGLPLYKNNRLVGGVGVIADGVYGLDADITDVDQDTDELIAVAATTGFAAPDDIRANRITADGRTFRFVDSESLLSTPSSAPAFAGLAGAGAVVAVGGYFDGILKAGVSFGNAASGIRADTGMLAAHNAFVLVDSANSNRYPVRAGTDGLLQAAEVGVVAAEALKVANRARAQIRRPLGTQAQVTVSIVDTNGEVLAVVRTPDAPVFGTDVSLQKARTALLFSHPNTAADLAALPPASYIGAGGNPLAGFRTFAQYVTATRQFLGDATALANGQAYSNRAVGLLARPFFPDGIAGSEPGPFSTPYANWSPFHLGLQLDLAYNAIVAAAGGSAAVGCTGLIRARNGIQIFPGAFPIYRGTALIGAIGVSGDGVDQDDMISFLGLGNASRVLNNAIGNAPKPLRADNIEPRGTGTRLRYVQCPQSPFNDSSEQNVCEGL
ncbi:MAG: heme-binding protein [Betaproteobacteria bacterium]